MEFMWYDYMGNFHFSNYELITIKNGKERRSFHDLNEEEVQKVINDYIAEGAKEVTNNDHIITARF